jgi:hypothetical protein
MYVTALYGATGLLAWRYETKSEVYSSPAIGKYGLFNCVVLLLVLFCIVIYCIVMYLIDCILLLFVMFDFVSCYFFVFYFIVVCTILLYIVCYTLLLSLLPSLLSIFLYCHCCTFYSLTFLIFHRISIQKFHTLFIYSFVS